MFHVAATVAIAYRGQRLGRTPTTCPPNEARILWTALVAVKRKTLPETP